MDVGFYAGPVTVECARLPERPIELAGKRKSKKRTGGPGGALSGCKTVRDKGIYVHARFTSPYACTRYRGTAGGYGLCFRSSVEMGSSTSQVAPSL